MNVPDSEFEPSTNEPPRPKAVPPPSIPDHELLRRIGRGSYGEVWLARSITGAYREIVPPERLVTTERWSDEWPETINTLVLTEEGGRTTTVLTVRYPSREAREAALRTPMREGMSAGYDRLEEYLHGLEA